LQISFQKPRSTGLFYAVNAGVLIDSSC
jgi:hypothetical protein